MPERIRKIIVTIPLPGTLAATAERGAWPVPAGFKGRVLSAALHLQSTGATSGSTQVDVNKAPGGANPASILPAVLSIAQGAATKHTKSKVAGGAGHPTGVPVDGDRGDLITVDVDAIPGTASANGAVFLEVAVTDV